MNHPCYALLDDATAGTGATSRLYTDYAGTLACVDLAGWLRMLEQMQQALTRGQHALLLATYELGSHVQGLATDTSAESTEAITVARILLFDRCRHLTPEQVDSWLQQQNMHNSAQEHEAAGIAQVESDVDENSFTAALAQIHAYIEAGDAYQVNYTYRLRFDAFGALPALYAKLRARQPVPYGALIAMDDGSALLSLSPELFVRHSKGQLTARPMKGTAPAANQPQEDALSGAALAADPKNRAENLMIVDLLRNDIGRVAVIGSVTVPALFDVQRYGDVLQMTSTVRATLRANASLADIFYALYPCGSITGAPKRRSMEIIDELEASRRGIYTGAIGWFDAPSAAAEHSIGDFCLSVPIRTLELAAPAHGVRSGRLGVGAGIVHDSDARDEYAECRLKARFLTGMGHDFDLFETMHASRQDGVRHLERHLQRLSASARYFGFACDVSALRRTLQSACAALPVGPQRLRLSLSQVGSCSVHSAPLAPLMQHGSVQLLLADTAVDSSELFLRHKTTLRARYDAGWRNAEAQGAFDTLFFNERGELTEGGRSNVFVKLDGRWCTPPLSAGVLPGVMRGVLLDNPAWAAREQALPLALLQQADEIVVCNALRGVLKATLQRKN